MKKSLIFILDFDGTVVSHEFPMIGKEIGAIPVLKKMVKAGHRLILHTMRSDNMDIPITNDQDETDRLRGDFLSEAVNWFKDNDIPLWGIQENPDQNVWTTSDKPHGDFCIDDRNIGVPLTHDKALSKNPFVNWKRIEEWLEVNGIIPETCKHCGSEGDICKDICDVCECKGVEL